MLQDKFFIYFIHIYSKIKSQMTFTKNFFKK